MTCFLSDMDTPVTTLTASDLPINLPARTPRAWKLLFGIVLPGSAVAFFRDGYIAAAASCTMFAVLGAFQRLPLICRLTLDVNGFTEKTLLYTRFTAWNSAVDFRPTKSSRGGVDLISWSNPDVSWQYERSIIPGIFLGYNEVVAYWGQYTPEQLADFMNRIKREVETRRVSGK